VRSRDERAAEYGLQGAMYALGMLYEDGKEVEKDLEKKQYWYDLADKANDS
jgi:TPR repeat protein